MPCVVLVLACINPLTNNDMGWFWPRLPWLPYGPLNGFPEMPSPWNGFASTYNCRAVIDYHGISLGHSMPFLAKTSKYPFLVAW
jgi:hypothetical protein